MHLSWMVFLGVLWTSFWAIQPSFAQDLTRYEVALDQMVTLTADFWEQNSQGQQASGKIYMMRFKTGNPNPFGFLKLNYNPPKNVEILANGQHVMLREGFSEEAQGTPIEATPIAFLLRPKITFKQGVIIQRIQRDGRHTAITVCQAQNPDAGNLTLVFEENPVRLKRWLINDPQGIQTQVTLNNVNIGAPIPPHIFQWQKAPR